MSPRFHSRGLSKLMWAAIAITFLAASAVTVGGLDPGIAGYVIGGLILACFAACAAAFWLDTRSKRATDRAIDRFGRRANTL